MTDETEVIQNQQLRSHDGIVHGFFTRRGGTSDGMFSSLNCGIGSGDAREKVLANRETAAAALGLSASRLATPYQVHGADIVMATEPWTPGEGPEADGIVTATPGLAIGVGTADCAPVLFADPGAGVVGAAHAGWGGAIKGVLEATVVAMVALGAEIGRISAAIGPAIAQPSYEVGPEFRERFLVDDAANAAFFSAGREGRSHFDLVGYVDGRLRRLGLASVSAMPQHDTYADEDRFFSFRRATHRGEPDYGRMISIIAPL